MPKHERSGPMDGHWATTLGLIRSEDNGKTFICLKCIAAGVTSDRAKIRPANNATNPYDHLKNSHPDIYSVVQ